MTEYMCYNRMKDVLSITSHLCYHYHIYHEVISQVLIKNLVCIFSKVVFSSQYNSSLIILEEFTEL